MKAGKVLGGLLGTAALMGGICTLFHREKQNTEKQKLYRSRYETYYEVTAQWLNNKNMGKHCDTFLREHHYKKIAIYGMGTLGEIFYEEIKNSDIEIVYMIDKNAEDAAQKDGIAVIRTEAIGEQAEADVIVITPVFDFSAICEDLEHCGVECDLISLEDIVFGI